MDERGCVKTSECSKKTEIEGFIHVWRERVRISNIISQCYGVRRETDNNVAIELNVRCTKACIDGDNAGIDDRKDVWRMKRSTEEVADSFFSLFRIEWTKKKKKAGGRWRRGAGLIQGEGYILWRGI